MAYMCVLAPSHECDGCMECQEGYDEEFDLRWDDDYADFRRHYERDEAYIRSLEE